MGAVLPLNKLVSTVRKLRARRKKIAFTNGCFDLLHVGHLDSLERIKRKADILVVAVNSDASVRGLKGKGRPVVPAKERARMVAGLKPVDYVVIFSEKTPLRVIAALQPDLLAKGGDWKPSAIVGSSLVRACGGKVVSVPYLKGHSTTRILENVHLKKR
jgi:D-beta-D-heptose 7-phosphate kinase/D-beta-D-heptose 1-phosphate adenosyltransferase